MPVKHVLSKIFSNFKGLDKRSSHLTRSSEYAVEAKNVRYRKSGAISKRKGSHVSGGGNKGGFGATTYKKVHPVTGAVTDEVILVGQDNKLYKLSTGTLTLTVNSDTLTDSVSGKTIDNSTNTYFVSIYPDQSTGGFIFKMTWEDETILEYSLGSGLDSSSPTIGAGAGNLDDLVEYVNASLIAAGSCSVTVTTTVPEIKWQESSFSNPIATYTPPPAEGTCTFNWAEFDYGMNMMNSGTDSATTYTAGEVDFPITQIMCDHEAECTGGSNAGTGVAKGTCLAGSGSYTSSWVEGHLTSSGGASAQPAYDSSTSSWTTGNPGGGTWTAGSNSGSYASGEHWRDNVTGFFGSTFSLYPSGDYIMPTFSKDNDENYGFNACISPTFTAPSGIPGTGNFTLKFKYRSTTSTYMTEGEIGVKVVKGSSSQTFTNIAPVGNTWTEITFSITNDGSWSNSNFHLEFYKNGTYATTTARWLQVKDIEILFQTGSSSTETTITDYTTDNKVACEFDGVDSGYPGVWNTISAQISASGSNSSTNEVKAAFLDTVANAEVKYESPLELNVNYLEEIPIGDAGYQTGLPFTIYGRDSNSQTSSTELENASFAQLNNVLYISNGFNDVMKYDGEKVYRAGLPAPLTAPTLTLVSTTGTVGLDTNNQNDQYYFYKYTYEYVDALGNIISSEPSPVASVRPTSNHDAVGVQYENLQAGCGFNIDTADRIKIKIYRTKGTETKATEPGAIYYLVNSWETPYQTTSVTTSSYSNSYPRGNPTATGIDNGIIYNNKDTPNDTYVDFLEDGGVGASIQTSFTTNEYLLYKTHAKRQDPPPKGKYLTIFQDCLVIASQRDNVNNIAYSLPFNGDTFEIGSEYFPNDNNQEIIDSKFGDKITAIAPLKDTLYVFHKNSIHTLTGSITEMSGLSYQIDLLTAEGGIGCEAHATVQELGSNLFFLSKNGIYSINNSEAFPREVSLPIQPEFKEAITTFNRKKAISYNWVKENSIIFLLPVETLDDGAETFGQDPEIKYLTTTNSSKIFVYDYSRQAWLEWTDLDFSGGITEANDNIYFSSRSLNDSGDFISYLYKMQDNGNTYDYADGINPISFVYKTSWEALGEPTIPKKFLRLKAYAFDADSSFESPQFVLSTNIQKNYIDQDTGSISLDFGGASSGGWGAAGWSVSSWGSQILDSLKTKLPSGKSKSLAVSFKNSTLNENVLLSGYEVEIAGSYKKEIKE